MSAKTFSVNGHRVSVRTIKERAPSGLADIGWTWSGDWVKVTIDGVSDDIGSMMLLKNGNWAWACGNWDAFNINHFNTLNKSDTISVSPFIFSYKTLNTAFSSFCRWIASELGGEKFTP